MGFASAPTNAQTARTASGKSATSRAALRRDAAEFGSRPRLLKMSSAVDVTSSTRSMTLSVLAVPSDDALEALEALEASPSLPPSRRREVRLRPAAATVSKISVIVALSTSWPTKRIAVPSTVSA